MLRGRYPLRAFDARGRLIRIAHSAGPCDDAGHRFFPHLESTVAAELLLSQVSNLAAVIQISIQLVDTAR